MTRRKFADKMHDHRSEIIRDARGRECARFVTLSGITAIVDTSIPMSALDKLIRKLERKLAVEWCEDCRRKIAG